MPKQSRPVRESLRVGRGIGLILAVVVGAALSSCDSPVHSFAWSMVPVLRSIAAGETATFTLHIDGKQFPNANITVAVADLPAGVTGDFPTQILASTTDRLVTLTTTAATPVGSHIIAITLTEAGGTAVTHDFNLQIQGAGGTGANFALEATPAFHTFPDVEHAQSFGFRVRALNTGYGGTIHITLEGLGDDVAVVQAPTPATVKIGVGSAISEASGGFVLRASPKAPVVSPVFITVRAADPVEEHTSTIELNLPTG